MHQHRLAALGATAVVSMGQNRLGGGDARAMLAPGRGANMVEAIDVVEVSAVERMVTELGRIGEVKIKSQAGGTEWWVQMEPFGNTPLWWYGVDKRLEVALQMCFDKAVLMGFVREDAAV